VTVTVSDYYVPSCEECCAEIERITRAAIRDFSVTKLTFTPGHRHNHEVEKSGVAPRISAPVSAEPPPPPSGELFIVGEPGGSALNGFDHAPEVKAE
jgi:hypothetical protein